MTNINKIATVLLVMGLVQTANAEISGSGTPNSGCSGQLDGLLWHDHNADNVVDSAEPGLPGISLYLFYADGAGSTTATTDAMGQYRFDYLCQGDYLVVIDEDTVPDGMITPVGGESVDDLGGWAVNINDGVAARMDLGYKSCPIAVDATCSVASLASELYRCEKPIDELSLIWNGEQTIRVLAYYGKPDQPLLADIDHVAPGDLVTVTGMRGSSDDVIWEIFAAGTDTKLGESKLRVACDDQEMDGPEDCGLPQGDGKDNKTEFINDWLLDGIVDDSGLLECTKRSTASSTCEVQSNWADCDLLEKVSWLTLTYTGGGCAASYHNQPDKFQCEGEVDSQLEVSLLTESGDSFAVRPGESFTIPTEGSDTELELTNELGTELMRIHTSCSKPLSAGDVFGSLTLAALNGIGIGAQIDYEYEVENKRALPVMVRTREAPYRTLYQNSFEVEAVRTVVGSSFVTANSNNAILAEENGASLMQCKGADFVDVIVRPREPCEISGSGLHIHNNEIRWSLGSGRNVAATFERILISWPGDVTDKLKEIKLDGDKIFDQDRLGSSAIIQRSDLIGDYHKRRVSRHEPAELKIVFDDDIKQAVLSDFSIEADFSEGCRIVW